MCFPLHMFLEVKFWGWKIEHLANLIKLFSKTPVLSHTLTFLLCVRAPVSPHLQQHLVFSDLRNIPINEYEMFRLYSYLHSLN